MDACEEAGHSLLFLLLGPCIAKRDGSVENHFLISRVRIDTKVRFAFKLDPIAWLKRFDIGFSVASLETYERIRVEVIEEGASIFVVIGVCFGKQSIVQSRLDDFGVLC